MKTIILLLLASFSVGIATAQDDGIAASAKSDLEGLQLQFSASLEKLKLEKEALTKMVQSLDPKIPEQLKGTIALQKEVDSLYGLYKNYRSFYLSKNVSGEALDAYFPVPEYVPGDNAGVAEPTDDKAFYMLFGDKKIPQNELLVKNEAVQSILSDVLAITEETCLGTFEIPGYRQKIELELHARILDPANKTDLKGIEEYLYFEDIKFSIREGAIYDLRVRLTDAQGKTQVYFENRVPISLLNFTSRLGADTFKLYYATATSLTTGQIADLKYKNYRVVVSDVLSYLPIPGNNFVPDDVQLSFPIDDEAKEPRRRVYKVNQKNSLQHIMELRTYTDFLGLFEEAANGIVQVEGKADFYLAPFQLFRGFPQTLFRKASPYVHFTRLDEDQRGLTLITDGEAAQQVIERPLEIIEKSYLDMGMLLDFYGFSFAKQFPFNMNVYGSLRYQIATIIRDDDENTNFKTLGTGIGLRIESRRLNNFGFVLSPELTYYNHLNRFEFANNPRNFWVFRNEAEIYYYPGTSKLQSIFLRLRTFMDRGDGEDSFFQLQFGYRFAIGLGNIKGKR